MSTMIFLSYTLLAIAVFSGAVAGILTCRLAREELSAGRRWLAHARKILYILLVACALFFLVPRLVTVAIAFFGLVCAYFKKIFNSPLFHLFPGFLFFLAANDTLFFLTLSVVLFLFYFISVAVGCASATTDFKKRGKVVILHHLPFFVCLPLYVFYL